MSKEQESRGGGIDGGRGRCEVEWCECKTRQTRVSWRCEAGGVGASTEREISQVITLGLKFLIS